MKRLLKLALGALLPIGLLTSGSALAQYDGVTITVLTRPRPGYRRCYRHAW